MSEAAPNSFQETQCQLASHLRDPDNQPAPKGIEDRRLQIYRDLVFNNIESFISSGFPVLRTLYDDTDWQALVRLFIVKHRCHSPYFLEISQEFLHFLQENFVTPPSDKPFLLELAHYEWVELALSVATEQAPAESMLGPEQILDSLLSVSPLAWRLSYQFPVHKIGSQNQPANAPEQPTFLVVYRNAKDQVQFMETNAVTTRLLQLFEENGAVSGEQGLRIIASEIGQSFEQLQDFGRDLLQQLLAAGILYQAH